MTMRLSEFINIAARDFTRNQSVVLSGPDNARTAVFSTSDKAWALCRSTTDKQKNIAVRNAFLDTIRRETGMEIKDLPQSVKDALELKNFNYNEADGTWGKSTKPLTAYRIRQVVVALGNEAAMNNIARGAHVLDMMLDNESGELESLTSEADTLIKRMLSGTSQVEGNVHAQRRASLKAQAQTGSISDPGDKNFCSKISHMVGDCRKIVELSKEVSDFVAEKSNEKNAKALIRINLCMSKVADLCRVCEKKTAMPADVKKAIDKLFDDMFATIADVENNRKTKTVYDEDFNLREVTIPGTRDKLNTILKNALAEVANMRSEIASLDDKLSDLALSRKSQNAIQKEHKAKEKILVKNNAPKQREIVKYDEKVENLKGSSFNVRMRIDSLETSRDTSLESLDEYKNILEKAAQKQGANPDTDNVINELAQKVRALGVMMAEAPEIKWKPNAVQEKIEPLEVLVTSFQKLQNERATLVRDAREKILQNPDDDDIKDLKNSIDAHDEAMDDLESQIQDILDGVENLETEITAAEDKYGKIDTAIKDLYNFKLKNKSVLM